MDSSLETKGNTSHMKTHSHSKWFNANNISMEENVWFVLPKDALVRSLLITNKLYVNWYRYSVGSVSVKFIGTNAEKTKFAYIYPWHKRSIFTIINHSMFANEKWRTNSHIFFYDVQNKHCFTVINEKYLHKFCRQLLTQFQCENILFFLNSKYDHEFCEMLDPHKKKRGNCWKT